MRRIDVVPPPPASSAAAGTAVATARLDVPPTEPVAPRPAAPATPSRPAGATGYRERAAILVAATLAGLGTLPYLLLKIAWLSGSTVGLVDLGMLSSPSMVTLNAVTLAMDVTLVGLVAVLASRWGRRLPAVTVLLPTWVGGGLLVPIALAILPATLLDTATTAGDGLAGWVRPMVYGGFAWQGAFLLLTFVLYARDRWAGVLGHPGPPHAAAVSKLQRATAVGGTVMAVLSGGLRLLDATTGGSVGGAIAGVAQAGLAVAGVVGVLALARPIVGRTRTAATAAGWVGSGAMFAWGLWSAVITMGASDLSGAGYPIGGLAALTGLLAGFALAVSGLLALAGTRITVP